MHTEIQAAAPSCGCRELLESLESRVMESVSKLLQSQCNTLDQLEDKCNAGHLQLQNLISECKIDTDCRLRCLGEGRKRNDWEVELPLAIAERAEDFGDQRMSELHHFVQECLDQERIAREVSHTTLEDRLNEVEQQLRESLVLETRKREASEKWLCGLITDGFTNQFEKVKELFVKEQEQHSAHFEWIRESMRKLRKEKESIPEAKSVESLLVTGAADGLAEVCMATLPPACSAVVPRSSSPEVRNVQRAVTMSLTVPQSPRASKKPQQQPAVQCPQAVSQHVQQARSFSPSIPGSSRPVPARSLNRVASVMDTRPERTSSPALRTQPSPPVTASPRLGSVSPPPHKWRQLVVAPSACKAECHGSPSVKVSPPPGSHRAPLGVAGSLSCAAPAAWVECLSNRSRIQLGG